MEYPFFYQDAIHLDGGKKGLVGRSFASSPGTNYNKEIVCESDKLKYANRDETDLAFILTKILFSSTQSVQEDLAMVFQLQHNVLKKTHISNV